MADARAGIRVVVHEHGAGQLLHEVGLFVRAAAGGDDAYRLTAVFRLDALHPVGGKRHRLGPGHLATRIGDRVPDHRLQDAVLVRGIAIGKAALDAGMAPVGLAVLVRGHADQFIPPHFRLEAAAHPAIGAGGDDAAVGRADLDHRLFLQGRGRAGLHAGAATDAIAGQRVVGLGAKGHAAVKAAAFERQGEGALHLLTRPHAAAADDAFRRIVGEIGVAVILWQPLGIGLATGVVGLEMRLDRFIAHIAQANGTRHVLQFAIAVRRTGQAVQRMVGDVQLHHAAPQLL